MRFRRRLILLYITFCCAIGVVWLRATQLQLLDGDAWAAAARSMRQRPEPLQALRGSIVSADGVVLAEDTRVFQLAVVAWHWQRRDRVRCSGCGAIYHPTGRTRADGTLRLRFLRSCACGRSSARAASSDAYPRARGEDDKPQLETLPPADLSALEDALEIERGTLARLAAERAKEVTEIVAKARARMDAEGDDTAFREKRLEMMEQDLLLRPHVVIGRMSEEAARLVLTDEVGRYRGFVIRSALRRNYPLGDFAAQLLGFTSQLGPDEYQPLRTAHGDRVTFNTRIGRKGLERAHNWGMHGKPGFQVRELDALGQFSRVVKDRPPRPGKPLLLSLDAKTSRLAEELLFHGRRGQEGGYVPRGRPSGAFVALDAYTGEVLIWAEAPRFDLNDGLDDLYDKRLVEAQANTELGTWEPRHPLEERMTLEAWRARVVQPAPVGMSRVAQVAVEPGSTMKPFMALGMLSSGLPLPFQSYHCYGKTKKPACHGEHTVGLVDAIVCSCNRYFAYSVRDSKYWPQYRRFLGGFIADLGLGQRPGEVEEWSAGQWLWPWVDFTMAQLVSEVRTHLERDMMLAGRGEKTPELVLAALPGTPETLGGDLDRLAKRLAKVAAWTARRTGSPRLALSVEPLERIERKVDVRFGVRSAARHAWYQLPGTAPKALPSVLGDIPAGKRGIHGHLERGGTVWFRARLERRVGRTDPAAPRVIRPDDGRNAAIGQGPVLVTPLQMARAVAVFANGGLLVEPRVARAVGSKSLLAKPRRLRLDPRHIDTVREGMYGVVNLDAGTADTADWHLVPATVYGKTGTAQVGHSWKPFGDTEEGGPWHHWFVGFAEAPGMRTIAFACVLHARSEGGAGATSAHAVADILSRWYDSDVARGSK